MGKPLTEVTSSTLRPEGGGVTLVGDAPVSTAALRAALAVAPRLVAADGGADRLMRLGLMPEWGIGDLDSISVAARDWLGPARLLHVAESETTDFDKAVRSVDAPFVLSVGFSGARIDHGLAVLNTLVRYAARRIFVLSALDLVFLAPRRLTLQLPVGTRVSLFPMGAVRGESRGLRWPLDGIAFAPDGGISTSNEVSARPVSMTFDADKMLVILPRRHLKAVLGALVGPA